MPTSPSKRRTPTISIRVTEAQKLTFSIMATRRSQTLGEFLLAAATAQTRVDLDGIRAAAKARPELPRRRRKLAPDTKPFRAPFLPRRHAGEYEEVVRFTAQKMRTDEHSVAILMTYLAEAISNVVSSGRVFRWPCFFAVGPYLTEGAEGLLCRPRFQAYPPLVRHVLWSCPDEMACNRELDAHRRRRRPDRSGSPAMLAALMRHAIAVQDLHEVDKLESEWREYSHVHAEGCR